MKKKYVTGIQSGFGNPISPSIEDAYEELLKKQNKQKAEILEEQNKQKEISEKKMGDITEATNKNIIYFLQSWGI